MLGTNLKVSSGDDKFYSLIHFIDITDEVFYKKELEEAMSIGEDIPMPNIED